MAFDFTTLITDRTAADFQHWEYLRDKGFENMTESERSEWLAGNLKGSYHSSDLNRVGEALNYLCGRLTEVGYMSYLTTFTAKTNWTITSIPTAEELTHYLKCVSNIREAMAQFENTPPTPTNTGALNIEEANNIEKILIDVETLINNMLAARFYCGDVYAGEI
jgi:hypothetical protein